MGWSCLLLGWSFLLCGVVLFAFGVVLFTCWAGPVYFLGWSFLLFRGSVLLGGASLFPFGVVIFPFGVVLFCTMLPCTRGRLSLSSPKVMLRPLPHCHPLASPPEGDVARHGIAQWPRTHWRGCWRAQACDDAGSTAGSGTRGQILRGSVGRARGTAQAGGHAHPHRCSR